MPVLNVGTGLGIDAATIIASFTTASADVLALMAGLLPVALGIFATTWGVRKAMRFFKSTTA